MPNRFYVRRFLNRPGHHAGGYVLASVEDTSRADDDIAWVEFALADCSRRVSLDFPLATRSERSNSVRKARMLLGVLEAFVEALEAEAALVEARHARRRAEK